MTSTSFISRLGVIISRECKRLISSPIYVVCMVIAPLCCYIFFTTLMGSGLPTNLPIGLVDLDNTTTSRLLARNLDAFQQVEIKAHYSSFSDARIAMQRGEIYGFFYLPQYLSRDAQSSKQPTISFYTNNAYLIAGSLTYRDMKMMGELASGAVGRTMLYAHGATETQAMAFLQPIVIDTYALKNPWLNYSVYLCNTLLPGVLMLLIMMITVYSIGSEIQDQSSRQWLELSGNNMWCAILGKLIPQTLIFMVIGIILDIYLYAILKFPCNCGLGPMIIAMVCLIISAQALGVFMIGALPTLRLGLSFASLWGVLSFSICGFTFPVMAMHPTLQALCNLFPLRHYFLIYVNQALNGYPMFYVWHSYVALLCFSFLPFIVIKRLKTAMITCRYIP